MESYTSNRRARHRDDRNGPLQDLLGELSKLKELLIPEMLINPRIIAQVKKTTATLLTSMTYDTSEGKIAYWRQQLKLCINEGVLNALLSEAIEYYSD